MSIGTKNDYSMKWGKLDKVISKVDSSYPSSFYRSYDVLKKVLRSKIGK